MWRFAPVRASTGCPSYTRIESASRSRPAHHEFIRPVCTNVISCESLKPRRRLMATPETCSVELDPLAPSFDGALSDVESEENQVVEADAQELSAYSFDSDDKTLVGIGSSDSASSSEVCHFDISDGTLVGIGPAERAKRAKLADLTNHLPQAEA